MQFSNTSGLSAPNDLIPSGYLCWALLTMRGMKDGQNANDLGKLSRYADLEFTIADKQPLARKKFWDILMDPDSANNTEGGRNMGMASLTRMMEATGLVNPADPSSYEKFNGKSCEQILMMLDGKYVAVRVKIENGTGGYSDKNKVGDYLSPNPQGSTFKNYTKLVNGDHGVQVGGAQAQRPGAGGFGGNTQSGSAAPVHAGGFGAPAEQQRPQDQEALRERPLDQTTRPSEGGFNPNAAPKFLENHQR